MPAALKPGDRICTIGGIYGTISRLKDDSVYIIAGADQKENVPGALGHPFGGRRAAGERL